MNIHEGRQLSKILGMGFDCRCIIVRPYNNYNVINVLGLTDDIDLSEPGQGVVNQNDDGSRCFTIQNDNPMLSQVTLPPLATKNLHAVTEAVWYADSSLNETIGIQLYWKIDHYRCSVTGDWKSYNKHYSHKWKTRGYTNTPVYIDFSSVNA